MQEELLPTLSELSLRHIEAFMVLFTFFYYLPGNPLKNATNLEIFNCTKRILW